MLAVDPRAPKIRQKTTYHDGSRSHVCMLWAGGQISSLNNYFSSIAQLNSLKRPVRKNPDLKQRCSTIFRNNLSKTYNVEVKKSTWVKSNQNRERYLPHHPVSCPRELGNVRRVLNGAAKCHGHLLNKAILRGSDLL